MRQYTRCCDCGTKLVAGDKVTAVELSLCLECWSRKPSGVIVQQSREHSANGHKATCGEYHQEGR